MIVLQMNYLVICALILRVRVFHEPFFVCVYVMVLAATRREIGAIFFCHGRCRKPMASRR